MQVGTGWYQWWCSIDFIPKALHHLEDAGCDMSPVKIVQDNNSTSKWNFVVIYKGVGENHIVKD
jgi:hypothetical protein